MPLKVNKWCAEDSPKDKTNSVAGHFNRLLQETKLGVVGIQKTITSEWRVVESRQQKVKETGGGRHEHHSPAIENWVGAGIQWSVLL